MNRPNELSERLRDWKPPVELTRSAPREVRPTAAGIALTILSYAFLVAAVAAGALLWRVAQIEAGRARALRDQGVTTAATVTRLWHTGGDDESYRVAYEFEHGGNPYRGESRAPRRIWRGLSEGEPLQVRFLPADPRISQPVDWQNGPLPLWLPPFLAIFLAGTGAFLKFMVQREARLLSEGRPAPAVVTRLSRAEHGARRPHYEFPLLNGSTARGRGGASRQAAPIGSTICILYDRDRPSRSAPYPMKLFQLPDIPRPRRL